MRDEYTWSISKVSALLGKSIEELQELVSAGKLRYVQQGVTACPPMFWKFLPKVVATYADSHPGTQGGPGKNAHAPIRRQPQVEPTRLMNVSAAAKFCNLTVSQIIELQARSIWPAPDGHGPQRDAVWSATTLDKWLKTADPRARARQKAAKETADKQRKEKAAAAKTRRAARIAADDARVAETRRQAGVA